MPVLVRLASHDEAQLARVLDAGVDGVIVPAVESAGQAGELVRAAYVPPRGRRSMGLARVSLLGRRDQPLLLPMVETRAGLDHLDDILGVDGVDGVFVGPYDLTLSLGRKSALDDAVVPAIVSVLDRTRERGRIAGIFTGNRELTGLLPAVDLLGVDTDAAAKGWFIVWFKFTRGGAFVCGGAPSKGAVRDIPDAIAKDLIASGRAEKTSAPADAPKAAPVAPVTGDGAPVVSVDMKADALKAIAVAEGVDLTGLKNKTEYVAAIEKARS